MPKACFVKHCRSVWTPITHLSFHQFPMKNEKLLKEWLASGDHFRGTPTNNSTLCSNHFSPDCFIQFLRKRTLKKNSVPTIFGDKPRSNEMIESNNSNVPKDDSNIKQEADDYSLQRDTTDQFWHVKEESIDIQEFKMEILSRGSCDVASQTDRNETRERDIRILSRKLKLLQHCFIKQQLQMNRMARTIHPRLRRYK